MPASPPTAARPNILLITTDQQRYDAMGLNNPPSALRTANLDHLAASGVNFSRAYATCPVCIPARRTLLTGLHPATHGLLHYQDGVEFNPQFTLPGLLRDAGYQTELIGKFHLHPQRKRFGFDHMTLSESPNHRPESNVQAVNDYTEWLLQQDTPGEPNNHGINGNSRTARPFNLDENYHQTSWTADCAIDFLNRRRDPSCPWFLHLSFWAPHPPLIPPQAYWDFYKDLDLRPTLGQWTPPQPEQAPRGVAPDAAVGPFDPEEIRRAIAGYFGLIHHIDDRIRAVLERYFVHGSSRVKEPTLIVFTSDHGEMLGDHHLFRKSLPYEAAAHVPFFIAGRHVDITPGTCDSLVGLEDVAATLLDILGLDLPDAYAGPRESKSLAPALRGQPVKTRDVLFGQLDAGRAANLYCVQGPHKYIRFTATGEEQLFHVIDDPHECRDRSGEMDLNRFRDAVTGYLKETGQPVPDNATLKPCANHPPSVFFAG